MKKIVLIAMSIALCFSLVACGAQGVPQEVYDTVVAENDELQDEIDYLNDELDSASAYIDELTAQRDSALDYIDELEMEGIDVSENDLSDTENGLLIHDDENVTLSYLSCGVNEYDEPEMVCYAVNKTDAELSFQCNSLLVDGVAIEYVGGGDSVAPQSEGEVHFYSDEEFPTLSPSMIAGTMSVIDFEETLWDNMSYDIGFLEFLGDGSAPTDTFITENILDYSLQIPEYQYNTDSDPIIGYEFTQALGLICYYPGELPWQFTDDEYASIASVYDYVRPGAHDTNREDINIIDEDTIDIAGTRGFYFAYEATADGVDLFAQQVDFPHNEQSYRIELIAMEDEYNESYIELFDIILSSLIF